MSVQIFKNIISKDKLFTLLDVLSVRIDNKYIFNKDSFKKGVFNNKIKEFLEECKENYHKSKQKYIEKILTYNSFTTILRQICNSNKIIYTSKIKYINSTYDIIYYIYKE